MQTVLMAAAGLLLGTAHSMASAQTAEMPTAKDFAVGETWEFFRVDALTKLEEARISATAVKTDKSTSRNFPTDMV